MSEGIVSPETLLGQLWAQLEVVAASSKNQLAWCLNCQIAVPVDEIPQLLDQIAFTHRSRISEAGLLPTAADAGIDDLLDWFSSMRSLDHPILWDDAGLDEPEWEVARSKARSVLAVL
jgi:hypothetical protein